jgi:hypothetical protein
MSRSGLRNQQLTTSHKQLTTSDEQPATNSLYQVRLITSHKTLRPSLRLSVFA